jgi:hypothetical protein
MTHQRRTTIGPLAALLAVLSCLTPVAQAKCPHGDNCLVCVPKREATKEEKSCWCVEGKNVAVPPILCPWEPGGTPINTFDWLERLLGWRKCGGEGCRHAGNAGGCPPGCRCVRCGDVRQVRDLVEKSYEVNDCQWKWEVRRLPPCRCRYCGCRDANASGGFGCGCEVGG